jgi:hypothetical protein
MKKSKFIYLCNKYLIDINIALENENILKALKNRDDKKIKYILENEF